MISSSMKPFVEGGSAIRALFEEGKKMAKVYGAENVYDFSVGNPGLKPPQEVYDAIDYINHELEPLLVYGYPSNAGYESTRQAVADDLNERFGDNFDMEGIVMTAGAGYAINIIMKCLLDPGDKVAVFAPYFVEYRSWARNFHADVVVVPPNVEGGFEPSAEGLRKVLDPSVKAVIICNPNNPTGAIYSRESLEAVAEVLREAEKEFNHPIYIISDEPYRELVYVDKEVVFLPDVYDDTIVAYSWSKSLSLPGVRIGYAAVPRKAEGYEELRDALVVAGRVLGANNASTIAELIVERAIKARADISYYERNAKELYEIVSGAGFECIIPQGAFYLWFKSPVENEYELVQAAKDERILIVPGSSFASPGWVRASFCISNETIRNSAEAFARLGKKYFG
ncbi:MAG: pyridoxal phosphate-dependent aminotransferase [Mogibacterium sp.]|nr:pyridoxal phosphate-dependent aminotransferase [Mogibacterium sp.]